MKTSSAVLFIMLILSGSLSAQDKDLKKIYTDVTREINSALLTRSGSMEISGSLSYSSFTTDYTDDEQLTQQIFLLEPVVSYFFVDNISLGIDVSYLNQKTEYKSSGSALRTEQTFIGPIAKMYFGEDRFRPFILADYLFLVGDSYDGGVLDLGAGVFYHVTGNFGFSLSNSVHVQSDEGFIGIGISNFIL